MSDKQYDNTNTAAVWANPSSLDNESAPVLRIKMNVDGVDKEIGLYLNESHQAYQEILEAVMDIVDISAESKAPVFRGKVRQPYRKQEESSRGGRSSRRGGGAKFRTSGGDDRSPNADW
jgi:hypothetical protein